MSINLNMYEENRGNGNLDASECNNPNSSIASDQLVKPNEDDLKNISTLKSKPLGKNNKTLTKYFDKVRDTITNITESKKTVSEMNSVLNVNGNESRPIKHEGEVDDDVHNETKEKIIDFIITDDVTNDSNEDKNDYYSQKNVNETDNEATSDAQDYENSNTKMSSQITLLRNLSSSFSQLNISSPLSSYADELTSEHITTSTDDLLSLDHYDGYDNQTKVLNPLASSCLNIASQSQINNSNLERWLSQSELLRPGSKLRPQFPRDGYFWSVALFIKLGRRLIPLNSKGRSDPYVKIKHMGNVLARSRMVSNNSNPVWDEKFWFRLCSLEVPVELKVYHRDAFKKDSYIGRTLVNLMELELDKEQEFVSRLEDDLHKIFTSGEIKFYVTLSEIEESSLDSSELKKLKKKLKEEKSRAFAIEMTAQMPREETSPLSSPDSYSVTENTTIPSLCSVTSAGSVITCQQSPTGTQSNRDSTEILESVEDCLSDDGQQQTLRVSEKTFLNRVEDSWMHENQSLLPQPIWPYSFYEGTNLELYTSRNQGSEIESIDKLHPLNNEIQMESLFQQSRLIVTLVGAKNLKLRGKQRNVAPFDNDSYKLLRSKSARSHNSDNVQSGCTDEEKSHLPCPLATLTVGVKTQQSKVVMHTKNPLWNERFEFRVRPGMRTVLQCEVFDDSHQNANLLGRFYLEFSKLVLDWTTCFTLKNQESRYHGELHILATMTGLLPISDPMSTALYTGISRPGTVDQIKRETESIYGDLSKEVVTKNTLDQVYDHYNIRHTLRDCNDVGWLHIFVHRASNLPTKDRSGKSNAFCEIRLVNRMVRTFTAQKNANPIWNQAFVLPIGDIYSILEVYMYEEGKDTSEVIGRVSFPLIQLVNRRQKWYALKDKSLTTLAKGSLLLETIIIYNPLRASLRAIYPKEKRYYVEDSKVKLRDLTKKHLPLIQRNIDRLTPFIDDFKRCRQNLYKAIKSKEDSESEEDEDDQDIIHPENYANYSDIDNEDEVILRKKKDKKTSFTTKLNKIRSILGTLQDVAEQITSFLERLDYLCRWRYPWLSCLVLIIILLITVLVYFVPIRYLVIAYTIKKFTRPIRNSARVTTTIFFGILNRVPSRMEKIYYRELRPLSSPLIDIKSTSGVSNIRASGLQVYSRITGYQSNAE
ncbi:unnamed protein product [Heterobilharzia americana]|nr:unnamed protein product [Heterobilharzia americana]